MEQKQIDWSDIRAEYIRDDTASYRKLAKKYDVGINALKARGKNERWVELRAQSQHKSITKTIEKIADRQAERTAVFLSLTDKAIEKLTEALSVCLPNDTQGLRQIVASLKDLKDMQNIKTEKEDEGENNTGVVFLPSVTAAQEVSNGDQ